MIRTQLPLQPSVCYALNISSGGVSKRESRERKEGGRVSRGGEATDWNLEPGGGQRWNPFRTDVFQTGKQTSV